MIPTTSIILFVVAGLSIAISLIGIQCYDKCENPKMNEIHPNNKKFLNYNLIGAICVIIMCIHTVYLHVKLGSYYKK